jgi:hypothetical protein
MQPKLYIKASKKANGIRFSIDRYRLLLFFGLLKLVQSYYLIKYSI